jgi:HEAT repeat protein
MTVTYASPYPEPEGVIALAIQKLRTPDAVPGLIQLLNEASDELVRSCASAALMEMKDLRALDAFASHLADNSLYVRYNSLIGIGYLTHAEACAIAKPEDAEAAELRCKTWLESQR